MLREIVADALRTLIIDNETYELDKKGAEKPGFPVEKLIIEAVQELIDKFTKKD